MVITIERLRSDASCTIGLLQMDEFSCATLERPRFSQSKYHPIRLPAGQYALHKETLGGFYVFHPHGSTDGYPLKHPIDIGNFPIQVRHAGILVGLSAGRQFLKESADAFDVLQDGILKAMDRGETVVLDLIDGDMP